MAYRNFLIAFLLDGVNLRLYKANNVIDDRIKDPFNVVSGDGVISVHTPLVVGVAGDVDFITLVSWQVVELALRVLLPRTHHCITCPWLRPIAVSVPRELSSRPWILTFIASIKVSPTTPRMYFSNLSFR